MSTRSAFRDTAGPWHVNAVKNGRIVGTETAPDFDKLFIHGPNATVAAVYRRKDARWIVAAANNLEGLLDAARETVAALSSPEFYGLASSQAAAISGPYCALRAAVEAAERSLDNDGR